MYYYISFLICKNKSGFFSEFVTFKIFCCICSHAVLYYQHIKVTGSIFSNDSICPPDTSRYQDLSFHGISAGKHKFDGTAIIRAGYMLLQMRFAGWVRFWYNGVDITVFSLWHCRALYQLSEKEEIHIKIQKKNCC